MIFILLIALPLTLHAITSDGADFYNSPTQDTVLVASVGTPQASKQPPTGVSGSNRTYPDSEVAQAILEAFPDAPIMYWVAVNESGLDPNIANPSGAKGLFQITGGTWRGSGCTGNVFNATDNIKCARKLYDKNHLSDWSESKYKGFGGGWGKHL